MNNSADMLHSGTDRSNEYFLCKYEEEINQELALTLTDY